VAKKTLTRTVTVINPDDGNDYTFTPVDDLPAWAEKLVTNPAAFESDEDYLNDEGEFDGGKRDAALNQRGRVRREVPTPAKTTSAGKSTPAKTTSGDKPDDNE
jgi:hypothetical protein